MHVMHLCYVGVVGFLFTKPYQKAYNALLITAVVATTGIFMLSGSGCIAAAVLIAALALAIPIIKPSAFSLSSVMCFTYVNSFVKITVNIKIMIKFSASTRVIALTKRICSLHVA